MGLRFRNDPNEAKLRLLEAACVRPGGYNPGWTWCLRHTAEASALPTAGAVLARSPEHQSVGSVFSRAAICPVQGASRRWTERPMALRSVGKWHEGLALVHWGYAENLRHCRRHDAASLWRGRQDGLEGLLNSAQPCPCAATKAAPCVASAPFAQRAGSGVGPGRFALEHASPFLHGPFPIAGGVALLGYYRPIGPSAQPKPPCTPVEGWLFRPLRAAPQASYLFGDAVLQVARIGTFCSPTNYSSRASLNL